MALKRDFRSTIPERAQNDARFREALLSEAINVNLAGDTGAGKAILRDLVNATIGFEGLAAEINKPSKSLHRMLAPHGNPSAENFFGIVKAMLETGIRPDFITVDGGEGGTGAAPMEFSDSVGTPLNEGLSFVHNALVGADLRDEIRVIASGKVNTGFQMATKVALGADMCNSARAMMFALGCIQALRCNTNKCPTGVATQDPELVRGLHVGDKSTRVARFHGETVKSFFEVLGAAGLHEPRHLKPWYVMRRVSSGEVRSYHEIYPPIEPNGLLASSVNGSLSRAWETARADAF